MSHREVVRVEGESKEGRKERNREEAQEKSESGGRGEKKERQEHTHTKKASMCVSLEVCSPLPLFFVESLKR